ncbi:MAG: D-alanyl-D-alanine carboxypeptidase [Clostridiaceae bacterium]|nr:D-alanyl-D-alanine carboxypeptidase [Clostridiaceae bacterium]
MKNLKKLFCKLFCFFSVLIFSIASIPSIKVKADNNLDPNSLHSEGVTLMDASSGQILFSKNGDEQFFPASTTKIVTALIVLENVDNLDAEVTIGENPPFSDGTLVGIKTGEIFTVKQLLLGLILESGNDCANALAEYVSGSIDEFSKLMNKRAQELGTKHSNFKNPSGLPDKEHVTTSNDLSLIMREVIKHQEFVDICQTRSIQLPVSNLGEQRWINNHNSILNPTSPNHYYPFAVCSKKGYTLDAKFTNVASATKDGMALIATCLRCENMDEAYPDTKTLFEHGFNNFTKIKLYSEGDNVDQINLDNDITIPLLASSDVYYTVKKGDEDKYKASIDYDKPENLSNKTIKRGDVLAEGTVTLNGEEIEKINLVSGITREYDKTISFKDFYNRNSKVINTLGIFILALLAIRISSLKKQKKIRAKKNSSRRITK